MQHNYLLLRIADDVEQLLVFFIYFLKQILRTVHRNLQRSLAQLWNAGYVWSTNSTRSHYINISYLPCLCSIYMVSSTIQMIQFFFFWKLDLCRRFRFKDVTQNHKENEDFYSQVTSSVVHRIIVFLKTTVGLCMFVCIMYACTYAHTPHIRWQNITEERRADPQPKLKKNIPKNLMCNNLTIVLKIKGLI